MSTDGAVKTAVAPGHVHKQSTPSLPRRFLAELGGTFAVVLVAVGAAAMRQLGVGAAGPLGIAVAYGIAYGGAIAMLSRFSGGHFNPAVTIAHWVRHRLGTLEALLYIAAQLAGAGAAAYALRLIVPATAAGATLLGPPSLSAGVTRAPALLIEAAMTFVLALALWATIAGRMRPHYWLGGIVAGVVVAVASYAGAPYTGGAMNPARAFGPALAARQWAYQGVYWVGPLAGAVAAASLCDLLFRRRQPIAPAAVARGARPPV